MNTVIRLTSGAIAFVTLWHFVYLNAMVDLGYFAKIPVWPHTAVHACVFLAAVCVVYLTLPKSKTNAGVRP